MESDRAFTKPHDPRVASGLNPLGNRDFALTAEQFDRAHFAQIHAHRIVSALNRFLLLGRFGHMAAVIGVIAVVAVNLVNARIAIFLCVLVTFDDIDAHFGNGGHDVLDLLGRHLVLRQRFVQFIDRDIATALGLGDQLLDRRFVEVDQRSIVGLGAIVV